MVILINSSSFIGIRLNQKYKARPILIICSLILLISILLASFVTSYIGYVFVYCVGFGITSGFMYLVPLNTGFKYPVKKGYVTGVIIAGYGFGSFIFNLIANNYVNPANMKPSLEIDGKLYFDKEIADNVPSLFRILLACYSVLLAIGIILVKEPEPALINIYKRE